MLQTAGWWRILPKAGEKGWKALIPVYNGYTYARAVRCPGLFYAQIAVILGYIVWILLLPFYLMTGSLQLSMHSTFSGTAWKSLTLYG